MLQVWFMQAYIWCIEYIYCQKG